MGQVVVRKVTEGSSHLVIRVDLTSDGTGELENYVILSPSDLVPAKPNTIPAFNLRQAWYSMAWFNIVLKTGTLLPLPLWVIARDCDSHIDFRSFGGVIDANVYSVPPADDDGKLTISTTGGFATLGAVGTLVLELGKTNRASGSFG